LTKSNTVTVDGSNGKGTSTRISFSDLRNDWILPNTGFERQSVSLSFNTEINQYIKLNAKINYYRKQSDNMPGGGYDETNAMYSLVWGQEVNSIREWKKEYFEGRFNYVNWEAQGENGNGLVFPSGNSYNPYRTLYEELNGQKKNRVFGNIGLTFNLAKGLLLDLKSGLDWSDEFRTQRKPFYTTDHPKGFYREQNVRAYEFNNDFMFRYNNSNLLDKRLVLSAMFGGNSMYSEYYNNRISLSQLDIENVYHLYNYPAGINPDIYTTRNRKMINSLYGMLSLSWDDTYFLDVTSRNDWSSTLARDNWSYFYPSVAASILLDRALGFDKNLMWIDMLKARLSWANVGNDTDPYSLDQYYSPTSFPGGYTLPSEIMDPLIQPENIESWELGVEGKLFKNRISFDLAVYDNSSTNQIARIDLDQITGTTGMQINVGEIQNRGIELMLGFTPVRTRDLTWSFDLNWSKNNNKLISLAKGRDPNEPLQTDMGTTIGSRTFIYSYVGQEMHVIYGKGYQKAPEGSFYLDENGNQIDCSGMDIVNASGYPVLDSKPTTRVGKVNPDWRAGMTQRLKYKNLLLSATFSAQYGGNAFSVTNFSLSYQGKLKNSLAGRYDGLVHPGVNAVTEGNQVVGYTKNTTVTNSIQTYYNANVWNRDNTVNNTFDTSFLKLKEVRLDYSVPAKLCQRSGFLQKASVGVFATNLFCWTDFPQYDPETGMMNGSQIYKGIEVMAFPMTRSYGVNLNLSF
jgi:outer membrane receptor protein involved in Fe transport